MIISRTPYRISFFGGGTDYPKWYLKYGGQVLSTSIDKYVYISCRYLPPFFEHRIRLVYGKTELRQNSNEITHPSAKAVLNYFKIKKDIEIHYDGDLPARSGMGSSSAFTIGLLHSLSKYNKIFLTKKNLAKIGIYIEQKIVNETVGSQDQISASFGGFNKIRFSTNGNFLVKPIKIKVNKIRLLEKKLMLFHTGFFRTAENVTKTYVKDFEKKFFYLNKMSSLVDKAISILGNKSLDDFGFLLNEAWSIKKNIGQNISNSVVNEIYRNAIMNGALGGKLLGAGGGGFIIFYVPENKQSKVRKALSKLLYIPFKFESNGSQIIYNQIQKQYKNEELNRSKQKLKPFKELKNFK